MNKPKFFHISDVLSVALGNTLVFKEAMTMPDGTTRPAYDTNVEGIVELIGHVTGHDLWNPRNRGQFDVDLMMHLLPHAQRALDTQCPWLRGVTFPEKDLPRGDNSAALAFCREWVLKMAQKQGAEWFEISEDPGIGRVHKVTLGGPMP